jgi:ABC-type phosphate/phosphonate transport system substrate-binding protein
MGQKVKFWFLVIVIVVFCAACSTDDISDQEQGDATKPPPQVRVGLLPTSTPLPPTETAIAPTPSPTAAQVFFWPTPNAEDLANQIDSLMSEIERKLKSQNTNIKP